MPPIPELIELLKAWVHFGHRSSKRYPKMKEFIHTTRHEIDIIDLEKTASALASALDFVKETALSGGVVLFISSKRQAKAIIEKAAAACGMPYVTARWLGGTFTNFSSIAALTRKLKDLEAQAASGELLKYTKKEQLDFQREAEKLSELVGGIKDMSKMPAAVFVIDIKKEKTALAEAIKKNVPIVALIDTNADPSKIQYPIPGNDDAAKSIELITNLVAQAVNEGKALNQESKEAIKQESNKASAKGRSAS